MATISTVAEKVKRKITGHSFYKASINLIAKLGKESLQTEPQKLYHLKILMKCKQTKLN